MAKATGFLEIDREETKSILPEDRVKILRNSYYHPQTKSFSASLTLYGLWYSILS